MKLSVQIGVGAGLYIGGFYAGWEVSRRNFRKRTRKMLPVLADGIAGIIQQGSLHNFDPEFIRQHTEDQMGIFREALEEALKS